MKRSILYLLVCLFILSCIGIVGIVLLDAQQKATPAQQIKQLKAENAKLKSQLETWETSYRKEIIKNAVHVGTLDGINKGIDRATIELQKGYDSGKLNYKELWDCGFKLNLDSSNVYQRPGKNKDRKDKK